MIKKAMRFLFNIPGKSCRAIGEIILLTLIVIFIGTPTIIVDWVLSENDYDIEKEFKELCSFYKDGVSDAFAGAIEND